MILFRLRRAGLWLGVLVSVAAVGTASAPTARASAISPATQRAAAYAIDPPLGIAGAAPLVMLNLSRDHQLFYKAYNDFSDLDGDGKVDTTYQNSFTYVGYFDSGKCYAYSSSSGYFVPQTLLNASGYCDNSRWSGNFLNWATMSRMDEVRKILYGGLRSQDDATTVLERAYLPTDAHSFAKYYAGSDISKLTPYKTTNLTAPSATDTPTNYYNGNVSTNENGTGYTLVRLQYLPSSLGVQVGDQIQITANNSQTNPATLIAPVRNLNKGDYGDASTNNRVELRVQPSMFINMSCTDTASCLSKFRSYGRWTITNLTRTGISFCNTTVQGSSTNRSQTNTAPPLIRVQTGNYALWASNGSLQCQWAENMSNSESGFVDGFLSNGNRAAFSGLASSAENPTKASGTQGIDWDELIARVQVCKSGLIGNENCRQYPDDSVASNPYKPIGLLQKYAETGNIKFGLVTPTFDHNASGGVLRAALPDPGTNDGDFISKEIDASTGRMIAGATGIISNINALRIYGYAYGVSDNYGVGNGCTYERTGITTGDASGTLVREGNCASWGNPMAESYIETLRYLAGKSPNSSFQQNASGEDAALGLTAVASWPDPISAANFCAALNVINFNASSLSYDTDAVGGYSDLTTGKSVQAWTDLVGVGEGINGRSWFVGNPSSSYSGSDADLCSAKTIGSLSAVQGICPEVPALKGGYLMAGAAYGAHVSRIRDMGNDSTGSAIVPTDDRTSLKVATFGVQLATNTPQIRVAVPGKTNQFVTIIPSYRLVLGTGVGGGALVDFKILSQTSDGTTASGSFYVDWEDSFAGGDYDQDMWGIISYEITATQVKITTRPVAASTSNGQGFGYVINGTTKDGPHFHSGIYAFNYSDPTAPDVYNASGTRINGTGRVNASGGCNQCTVSDAATTAIYAIGSSSAGTLSDPLLYASKWGGFRADTTKPDGTDTPANDLNPADRSKWSADGSGTPDNYFLVTDPGALETSLDTLFRKILAKISSGTAATTVAASSNGVGVTYQAFYEAERTDTAGDRATWAGSLGSLWTDAAGLLREDGNHNNQLDDYTTDPVIEFAYQSGGSRTVATRYTNASADPKVFVKGTSVTVELSDLNTLWNARQQLWDPAMVNTQRVYGTPFSSANGRYIFTWVDANGNGAVDSGEIRPFVWSTSTDGINPNNYRYLNSDSTSETANIIDWIRGKEISGLRNRTVDYGATTDLRGRVTRLGDIINSSPLAVAAPAEAYDLLYNDSTYGTFRATYRDRRQMVYVGANDGMLHAFNAGFYNASCQRFTTQPNNAVCTSDTPNATGATTSTPTAHPLGGEIWAYVPKNVLPHLRWLTDPNYKHTYYVDGAPIAFDAKVFTADSTHVSGWGTVLLVPFRLGGGSITVNTASSGTNNVTSDSAYVLMDVTNPEVPPTVLGEITLPGTYALSAPAVVMVRNATSGSPSKFFVAIGSGPTDPRKVASNQNLRVSIYDVADFIGASSAPTAKKVFDLGTTAAGQNSFAGDLIGSDFNLDGKAEAIYFGSVLGTGATSSYGGHFWRIAVNGSDSVGSWTAGRMLDLTVAGSAPNGMPVTVRPTLARNERGAPMVYFGTGRLYNSSDKATSTLQRIYGVIDTTLLPSSDAQYLSSISVKDNLIDVTNVNVFDNKSVTNIPSNAHFKGVTDFAGLAAAFDSAGIAGWYRNLTTDNTNPSERVVSAQALLGGVLLTAAYTPGTSICTGLGTSVLYSQNYETGTGDPSSFFDKDASGKVNVSTVVGPGLPAPPSLHTGSDSSKVSGSKKVTACIQTSTGAIVCKDVATLDPVTSGESSWREPLGK